MIRPCAAFGGSGYVRVTVGQRTNNSAFLDSFDLITGKNNSTYKRTA